MFPILFGFLIYNITKLNAFQDKNIKYEDKTTNLKQLQDKCCFKPGETYNFKQIKEKLGTLENIKLFCLNPDDNYVDKKILRKNEEYYININMNNPCVLKYFYIKGLFWDEICFKKDNYYFPPGINTIKTKPGQMFYCFSGDTIKFNTYCDTIEPPKT